MGGLACLFNGFVCLVAVFSIKRRPAGAGGHASICYTQVPKSHWIKTFIWEEPFVFVYHEGGVYLNWIIVDLRIPIVIFALIVLKLSICGSNRMG